MAPDLVYGQVLKRYRRRRVVRVEYVMQWGVFAELKTRLQALGLSGRLNTAFVERVNLTLRQSISLLVRRTWGTAQTPGGLKLHLAWTVLMRLQHPGCVCRSVAGTLNLC